MNAACRPETHADRSIGASELAAPHPQPHPPQQPQEEKLGYGRKQDTQGSGEQSGCCCWCRDPQPLAVAPTLPIQPQLPALLHPQPQLEGPAEVPIHPQPPKAGWVAPGVHAGVPYPALRGPGMLTRVTARTHRAHPQTPPASLLESSHFTSSNESSGNGICPQALGGIPLPGSCVFTFPEQNADPSAASWLVPTRHGHISF